MLPLREINMEADFWHQRWAKNEIGFHEGTANKFLVKHFHILSLTPGSFIFIPLCGKTRDIGWLLAQGYHVVGVELSEIAIQQLFAELGMQPNISNRGKVKQYQSHHLTIYVGDLFNLTQTDLEQVDAIYDRAALVAFPQEMRWRYAQHLKSITQNAPQLLICFEYEQSVLAGPPFSVDQDEVKKLYSDTYKITNIETHEVIGGLKGLCAATEVVWHLR